MDSNLLLNSIKDTENLAKNIANLIQNKPALIFLQGDLGAGKTLICQTIIKTILNKNILVTSPTYSYMNAYHGDIDIYHFDLYRIDDPNLIKEMGLLEYLNNNISVRLIEWPDKILNYLASPDIIINLYHFNNKRKAKINYLNADFLLP